MALRNGRDFIHVGYSRSSSPYAASNACVAEIVRVVAHLDLAPSP